MLACICHHLGNLIVYSFWGFPLPEIIILIPGRDWLKEGALGSLDSLIGVGTCIISWKYSSYWLAVPSHSWRKHFYGDSWSVSLLIFQQGVSLLEGALLGMVDLVLVCYISPFEQPSLGDPKGELFLSFPCILRPLQPYLVVVVLLGSDLEITSMDSHI
jgi:hypothetical protein